ncbi:MAG: glutamine-hydrolyzing GMP synthase [Parcubacteria group bacterium]|nr:glutamine-hydrolyzing GMP synthase [Parcubacteria group bacterium]
MKHIAIIDFGSQYAHLIARRIRELGVLSKIYPSDISAQELKDDVIGIILSGGPQSVYGSASPKVDAAIFDLGVPVLGLCYGHQLMAHILGGAVAPGAVREYGRAHVAVHDAQTLLSGVPSSTVWMSHGDSVTKLPEGFAAIGETSDCPIAAMANPEKNFYGLQFHPEVRHTEHGVAILKNFVYAICRAEKNWNVENMIDGIIAAIKKTVGSRNVFLLVSGGVDSSVAFALLTRALGKERVYGLYIDTGFMRLNESEEIQASLKKAGFENLHVLDARETFYERLKGVCGPEEKRKIIGQTFLDVKDRAAEKLNLNPDEWMLGQGTIYPDTIETGGTKHADTIKTHHNRVDAVQKLLSEGKVIEPIADFYKDEVRAIGALLGLPHGMINRHPFPGPGLAIRILCHNALPRDDKIASPAARNDTYDVLPIQSVGVQGDNRTYAHPAVLTASNPPLPEGGTKGGWEWEELDAIASAITNKEKTINRVLLLLNPAGESVFRLPNEARTLTPNRTKLLQKIDAIVHQEITDAGLYDDIWQFPVALIPVGHKHFESIILRPVESQEAMTARFYRMPQAVLARITEKILATGTVDYIFYDITNKPPGTIEWE